MEKRRFFLAGLYYFLLFFLGGFLLWLPDIRRDEHRDGRNQVGPGREPGAWRRVGGARIFGGCPRVIGRCGRRSCARRVSCRRPGRVCPGVRDYWGIPAGAHNDICCGNLRELRNLRNWQNFPCRVAIEAHTVGRYLAVGSDVARLLVSRPFTGTTTTQKTDGESEKYVSHLSLWFVFLKPSQKEYKKYSKKRLVFLFTRPKSLKVG